MRKRTQKSRRAMLYRLVFFSVLAALFVVFCLVAPMFLPNDPMKTNATCMKAAPSAEYPFGTDELGRCVMARVMLGARTSVFPAFALVAISFVIGTTLGLLCGYYGGFVDSIIMRLADVLLALPQMVLAIAVAGILGGSLMNAMIALGITGWTSYARLARSSVMKEKNEAYVSAARLSGCGDVHILVVHLFPNIIGPLLINAAMQIGTTMIGIAGLSFLGIGVMPPTPEWGSMISEAYTYMKLAPWATLAPAVAMIATVIIFNCLGDSVQDWIGRKELES